MKLIRSDCRHDTAGMLSWRWSPAFWQQVQSCWGYFFFQVSEYLLDHRRVFKLRGVGPMVATALVATVGDAKQYHRGRQMAAAIGLTPRQHSSGGKDRLLGISKRGDVYLRTLLIHGARAVVTQAKHKDDRLSRWVTSIAQRRHPNVAAVALANKTARMAWAMLRNETDYDPDFAIS